MIRKYFSVSVLLVVAVLLSVSVHAQNKNNSSLFDNEDILNITLRGSLKKLLNNRSDQTPFYPISLLFSNGENNEQSIPVEVKTRGHSRKLLNNCSYPPLLLHFINPEQLKNSMFSEQNKMKLVMPCKGDEYVVKEWLVYKLYNLFTPLSFKARLVKVKLEDDSQKPKNIPSFYGILLEEEKQLAKRNHLVAITRNTNPKNTDKETFLQMAVFEYMIGNTDWSVQYQQNIKLLAKDSVSTPFAVPYDFDNSGFVSAPYAKPAEELELPSVIERRYRGYCITDMMAFNETINKFNLLKSDIYQLYTSCPLLDTKSIKQTTAFLDKFFVTINDIGAWQKDFSYPCDPNGTGNVVIKGLKGN